MAAPEAGSTRSPERNFPSHETRSLLRRLWIPFGGIHEWPDGVPSHSLHRTLQRPSVDRGRDYLAKELPAGAVEPFHLHLFDRREIIGAG